MNNSEFINELSTRLNLSSKEAQKMSNSLLESMSDALEKGDEVVVSGFGAFETRQKQERVIVHPATGKRMLVPPKQVLVFKQAASLKAQAKSTLPQNMEEL